jgi:hypothetical protein
VAVDVIKLVLENAGDEPPKGRFLEFPCRGKESYLDLVVARDFSANAGD